MVLPRDKQDIRNQRAKDKRKLLKLNEIIVEPEEPLKLNEIIEEPLQEPKALIEIIEEPLQEPEPEPPILTKAEITANKRRATLAFVRS